MHEQQLTLKGQIKSEPHLDAAQRCPYSKGKSPIYNREGSREVSIPTPAPSTQWSYLPEFGEKDVLEKRKQKVNFDLRHSARPLLHWNRTERVDHNRRSSRPWACAKPTSYPNHHTWWKHLLACCNATKRMPHPDQQRLTRPLQPATTLESLGWAAPLSLRRC